MHLKLTRPYDPGMNDPGNTYPKIYITQMTDNPQATNFQFIYEAGDFVDVKANETDTETVSTWVKGSGMLAQIALVAGDDYIAAIKSKPLNDTDSAYQSIRRILYTKLIASGFDGTIVDG